MTDESRELTDLKLTENRPIFSWNRPIKIDQMLQVLDKMNGVALEPIDIYKLIEIGATVPLLMDE